MYKFYLDGQEVLQPMNFSRLVYKRVRSEKWRGMMYDTFGYVDGLKDLEFYEPKVKEYFNLMLKTDGILANFSFQVKIKDRILFDGEIDISTISIGRDGNYRVTLKDAIEQNKIDSRGDVDFALTPNMKIFLHKKYIDESDFSGSWASGIRLWEVFEQLITKITDGKYGFDSDFLKKQTDILTSGENIRGLSKPLNVGILWLFEQITKIYNLKGWIENDTLRVEPMSYERKRICLGKILRYERFVSTERMYSSIKVGYEKWQSESKIKDDEFNSTRSYTTNATMVKNELDLMSKVITAGYLIEETRRIQFDSSKKDAEWKYDNDLFLISAIIKKDGFYSQKNESYSNIQGIYDPKSVYNLKFSPARNLWRWKENLKFSGELSLVSSTGNSKLSCIGGSENIYINEDLSLNIGSKLPFTATFEKYMSFEEFEEIGDIVEYDCGNNDIPIVGEVLEVEFMLSGSKGMGLAKFKVFEK